jgi:ABC-type transporter lipoprotein component MlaA
VNREVSSICHLSPLFNAYEKAVNTLVTKTLQTFTENLIFYHLNLSIHGSQYIF